MATFESKILMGFIELLNDFIDIFVLSITESLFQIRLSTRDRQLWSPVGPSFSWAITWQVCQTFAGKQTEPAKSSFLRQWKEV